MARICTSPAHGGKICGNVRPIKGTEPPRCYRHGGRQQKGRDMRAFLEEYRLGTNDVDPAQIMLKCVGASWYKYLMVREELAQATETADSVNDSHVGTIYGEGGYEQGEYLRGLSQLEVLWFDRAQKASTAAVNAGIADRVVKQAEALALTQATAMRDSVAAAMDAAGIEGNQRDAMLSALGSELRRRQLEA